MKIIVGIGPGPSGTGRAVRSIIDEARRGVYKNLQILLENFYDDGTKKISKVLYETSDFESTVVRHSTIIIHPQYIGFKRTLDHIKNSKNMARLYLMDASFFCLASYNYLSEEFNPCLKCLGGNFEEAKRMGCKPWPVKSSFAEGYLKELSKLAKDGSVGFFAQNKRQSELCRKHFGENAVVDVTGMWAVDWELSDSIVDVEENSDYDVVFHGHNIAAKGVKWALDLAVNCKDLKFLFPFPIYSMGYIRPFKYFFRKNIFFRKMSWERGLSEAVKRARATLVPSMWSAPIEGSLIKTVGLSKLPVVNSNDSSFAGEIIEFDSEIILSLPSDHLEASKILSKALQEGRSNSLEKRKQWYNEFSIKNKCILDKIYQYFPSP